jgi:N-acyl-L-homoserine lactone synthetase
MSTSLTIAVADEQDRATIYTIRHQVYAEELRQHQPNSTGRLEDALDRINLYLVAKRAGAIAGFVSITPPTPCGYSVEKYFARQSLPLVVDERLYEVRLLTVTVASRRSVVALLLMYAALRYTAALGARAIVATGRLEVLPMYRHAGLKPLGMRVQSGAVVYELMTADICDLLDRARDFERALSRLERQVDWQVDLTPFRPDKPCNRRKRADHAVRAHGEASGDGGVDDVAI